MIDFQMPSPWLLLLVVILFAHYNSFVSCTMSSKLHGVICYMLLIDCSSLYRLGSSMHWYLFLGYMCKFIAIVNLLYFLYQWRVEPTVVVFVQIYLFWEFSLLPIDYHFVVLIMQCMPLPCCPQFCGDSKRYGASRSAKCWVLENHA